MRRSNHFKRGFNFINIPTTLLSQVDASVGGKLGIDFNNYSNLYYIHAITHTLNNDKNLLSRYGR